MIFPTVHELDDEFIDRIDVFFGFPLAVEVGRTSFR